MAESIKHKIFSYAEVKHALDKLKPIFKSAPQGLTLAEVIAYAKSPEEEAAFRTAFTLAMEHRHRFVAGFDRVAYERLDEHRHQIRID